MENHLQYKIENGIAVIAIQAGAVNALGQAVRAAIWDAFENASNDETVRMIVITSAGRFFSAGADISEFGSERAFATPSLPELCDFIDVSKKPVVAGINGDALGGGLELALAADYRLAVESVRMGLPEVTLGIIPGAGGTQRLPRFAGAKKAVEMISSGKPVSASVGHAIGLVDVLLKAENFEQQMLQTCQELLDKQAPALDCADRSVDVSGLEDDFFAQALAAQLPADAGGFAARKAVEAVACACEQPLAEGLASEAKLFKDCEASAQARAQQHLFFAQRSAGRIEGINKETLVKPVQSVAVVGAGLMGSGIAMCFLDANIPVLLLDSNQEGLERGQVNIQQHYEKLLRKARISEDVMKRRLSMLSVSTDYSDVAPVDMVVEAVFEDMAVKKSVFAELDKVCKPGCILASNTSTLDLDELAASTSRPADVIGMHFFSPAQIMKLVEIVRGSKTTAANLKTVYQLSKRLGKVAVVVGVCYGFVGNRMVAPYSREAFRVLLEGASPEQSDAALTEFGMAMGAVSMADMAGIDVGCSAAEANKDDWADESSYQALQFALRERGWLGQKTGRGVYRYEGRQKQPDPEVSEIIVALASDLSIAQRELTHAEIADRCILMLVNEGARILEEGIAARASDIDLIYVNGYGFPAWRGGPMRYADEIGLKTVVDRLQTLQEALGAYGERWFKPAPLLVTLAEQNSSFAERDQLSAI